MNKQQLLSILAIAMLVFVLFYKLGKQPLYVEEPRRALVTLEMKLNENIVVPSEFGEFYYNKPPLWNWVLLVSAKLFGGFNEWSVRIPAVFFFLLTGIVLYITGKHFIDKRFGYFSAMFYLVSIDFIFYFSFLGEIDLFYAFLIISMFCLPLILYDKNKLVLSSITFYLLGAAGILTKGMPTFIFMASIWPLLFVAGRTHRKNLFSWQHIIGVFPVIILVGGYFGLYSRYSDPVPYLQNLFFESAERTKTSDGALKYLLHFLVFPFDILKNLLPALLFLPVLFVKYIRNKTFKQKYIQYGVIIFIMNILVYLISPGARQRYIYMLYPFLINILVYGFLLYADKHRKTAINWAWILIFTIIGLRFVYSEIVFADRSVNSEAARKKLMAKEFVNNFGDDIAIYRSEEMPRSIVFYITNENQKVVEIEDSIQDNTLYISRVSIDSIFTEIQIVKADTFSNYGPFIAFTKK